MSRSTFKGHTASPTREELGLEDIVVSNKEKKGDRIDLLFRNVKWSTKTRYGGTAINSDVSVTKIARGFSIIFRNGLRDTMPERIAVAIKGNTVLFKGDPSGWTVSGKNCKDKKSNGTVQISKAANPELDLTEFIGDYEIKYFEPLDIWYIQKETKR